MTKRLGTTAVVSGLTLGGAALNFLAQLLIARGFGAGAAVDAFFVALSLPLLVGGIVSGIAAYQLVPVLVRVRARGDAVRDYESALIAGTAIVAVSALALGGVVSELVIATHPMRDALVRNGARVIAWCGWIGCAASTVTVVLAALCHARERFLRVAVICLFPGLGSVAACWLARKFELPLQVVAGGMVVGQCLAAVWLALGLSGEIGLQRVTRQQLAVVQRSMAAMGWVIASTMAFTAFGTIDSYLGPIVGEGAVATLAYGQRIAVAVGNVAVSGIGVVVAPRLSRLSAMGNVHGLLTETKAALRTTLLATSVAGALVALSAGLLIEILFVGGRFTTHEAAELAGLVRMTMPGMVAMSGTTVIFRAIYAAHAFRAAAVLGLLSVALYGILGFVAVASYGTVGAIGGAYTLTWVLTLVIAWRALIRRHPQRCPEPAMEISA